MGLYDFLLDWCKSNCNFCIVKICHLILEYILNKCGYVTHHFNVHFSLYVFLLMTYYLLFILCLFWTIEMLNKMQIWTIFLFEFTMGRKAAETAHSISTSGLGAANTRTVQWWFKRFRKGGEHREDDERSDRPSGVDSDQLRASLKLILQPHEKLLKNSVSAILWFCIWSKLERWKSSISGCLMSWPKIQKIVVLKCCLLLFYATANHFSIRLWCVMKNEFYMTTSNNQLVILTKKKLQSISQSQTCTKKRAWSLFGGLLLVWSTIDFWILEKPLHMRSMLSKSMRSTKNWSACSGRGSTKSAPFFSSIPNCSSHNQYFKSGTNWATKFCLIHHIHLTSCQPTTTSSSILTTFCRKNASTSSRMQKMCSKSSSNSKTWIFML